MLPSFDTMLAMSKQELNDLLQREVQIILDKAHDKRSLELLQSHITLQLRAKRLNYVTIFEEMWKKFNQLNNKLNGV